LTRRYRNESNLIGTFLWHVEASCKNDMQECYGRKMPAHREIAWQSCRILAAVLVDELRIARCLGELSLAAAFGAIRMITTFFRL